MCDYSLMHSPNRLASEEEDLVTYRFKSGSIGLASLVDLNSTESSNPARPKTFWSAVKEFFASVDEPEAPAVCVPPGALLLLMDIAVDLRDQIGVGRIEKVTFTQITPEANRYRDAVRFANGREILLQHLHAGQRVRVLSLTVETTTDSRMYSSLVT